MPRFERALWLVRTLRGRQHLRYRVRDTWCIWLPLALIGVVEWVFLEWLAA